jgi:glycerophosphoryl diester phosphodiesterase
MPFDLQGHRGARGLKPENTLPSFEAAFDVGVSSVETDLHLTRDGVPVLIHDAVVPDAIATLLPGEAEPPSRSISQLTLLESRRFRLDRNPDPRRFATQDNHVTPAAELFARARQLDPYAMPALADLFAFADAYAGSLGERAGKTPEQRAAAARVRFDLELKRVPFEPERIGDGFDGSAPGLLERRVVEEVRSAGVVQRASVRSFDHRSVQAVRALEPALTTAVLMADNAPASPVSVVHAAGATVYCPEYRFLDESMFRALRAGGIVVIPWTVNRPEDWERLLAWGVDGITTDYPDRLAARLGGNNTPEV